MLARTLSLLAVAAALTALGGCDMLGNALGIESPEKLAAARDAEGKAIGGACRNAARGIEDCFALNKKADKAAIFAGWREMNDYMRENKIDALPTQVATDKATAGDAEDTGDSGAVASKPAPKADAARRGKGRDS